MLNRHSAQWTSTARCPAYTTAHVHGNAKLCTGVSEKEHRDIASSPPPPPTYTPPLSHTHPLMYTWPRVSPVALNSSTSPSLKDTSGKVDRYLPSQSERSPQHNHHDVPIVHGFMVPCVRATHQHANTITATITATSTPAHQDSKHTPTTHQHSP